MIVTALENSENRQIDCEASLKCLLSKVFPCNFQSNGSSMEGFTKLKNEPGAHPAGNVTELNCHLNSEFHESSNEFHSKPSYHQNYSTWTLCYFSTRKLQQCQMNGFESHFYPYPVEKKGIKNSNFTVVTWSNWDCRVMLESECRFKKYGSLLIVTTGST